MSAAPRVSFTRSVRSTRAALVAVLVAVLVAGCSGTRDQAAADSTVSSTAPDPVRARFRGRWLFSTATSAILVEFTADSVRISTAPGNSLYVVRGDTAFLLGTSGAAGRFVYRGDSLQFGSLFLHRVH